MASAKNPGALPGERRRHPRAATSLRAQLGVAGARHRGKVINLSMGGALLDFPEGAPRPTVQRGDQVTLHVHCPATGATLTTDAKVVLWNERLGPSPLLAIQFDEMSEDAEDILEELMAEALVDVSQVPLRKTRAR